MSLLSCVSCYSYYFGLLVFPAFVAVFVAVVVCGRGHDFRRCCYCHCHCHCHCYCYCYCYLSFTAAYCCCYCFSCFFALAVVFLLVLVIVRVLGLGHVRGLGFVLVLFLAVVVVGAFVVWLEVAAWRIVDWSSRIRVALRDKTLIVRLLRCVRETLCNASGASAGMLDRRWRASERDKERYTSFPLCNRSFLHLDLGKRRLIQGVSKRMNHNIRRVFLATGSVSDKAPACFVFNPCYNKDLSSASKASDCIARLSLPV